MKQNISNIHNCFGCGVCAISCPKKIINIRLNKEGFYEPYLEKNDKCIHCGICIDVCSFSHSDISLKTDRLKCWAGWSHSKEIRSKCASGGISYEISKALIKEGFKFIGVKYDTNQDIAVHYIAENVEELKESLGSKYIQSYPINAFKSIDKKHSYLIVGTPCQIDSFRRYIKRFKCEENFILIDFFCHGIPSYLLWKKYIKAIKNKIGSFEYVAWRNKIKNWHEFPTDIKNENLQDWHDSYNIIIKGEKNLFDRKWSNGDLFYYFFLGNDCLGKACYNCRFKKKNSSADIRLGDMWGKTYENNKYGVNCIISFTEKGENIISKMPCELISYSFDKATEGQVTCPPSYSRFKRYITLRLLKSDLLPLKIVATINKILKRLI